jgi:hypothetical protein
MDTERKRCDSPHVVILGAGASIASTIRNPEKNGKSLPGMPNLVETLGLEPIINDHGVVYEGQNFEAFYDELAQSGQHPALLAELESAIYDYFAGLQLPDEATIYDYLVLSLREKDIIATFNWDPFLAQAYYRNMEKVGFERMPRLAFLHGNVAVGVCYNCKTMGWIQNRCSQCHQAFSQSKLLYPVGQKDYSADAFIKGEWDTLRDYMRRAYFVTVFGYSAPKTDAEARKLLLDEWQANPVQELAQINIIDILAINDRKALTQNWDEFFVRDHYGLYGSIESTRLFNHPRRTCDAFAMATLMLKPWHDNAYPQTNSLDELQKWLMPLIEEEKTGQFSGEPCNELRSAV